MSAYTLSRGLGCWAGWACGHDGTRYWETWVVVTDLATLPAGAVVFLDDRRMVP